MTKPLLILSLCLALGLAVMFALYGMQSADLKETRAALEAARSYIDATNEAQDALDSLPNDPADILDELRRRAE